MDGYCPAPSDQRRKRKLDTFEDGDENHEIATESLDIESDAISDSKSSKDSTLHPEVEIPITKLSAVVAWDWHRYVESTHDQFCEQCREWFAGWEDKLAAMAEHKNYRSSESVAHHLTKKSFSDAIESGCPFCRLIYDKHCRYNSWLRLDNMKAVTGIPFTTMLISESDFLRKEKCVDVHVKSPGENSFDCMIQNFTFWHVNSAFSGTSPPKLPLRGSSTKDEACLKKLKTWFEICTKEHIACEIRKHRTVPTRLLHWTGKLLQLQNGSQIASDARYATLSHCWGVNPSILKLNLGNVADFHLSIPVEQLCQTFQDALFILQYIGLEYLWIDSLCIIQDSTEDWEREAALMSAVYGFSELTIAASRAKDGGQGLFTSRNLTYPAVIQLSTHRSSTVTYSYYDGRQGDHYHRKEERFEKMPLTKRAWAFQERLLSPRVIFFNETEISWLCAEGASLESNPFVYLINGPMTHRGQDWQEIVQQYSGCDLTYEKDRLVALSGLARRQKESMDDMYLAGMWRQKIEDQLCWYRDINPLTPLNSEPANDTNTPSWSWACRGGRVKFAAPWSDTYPNSSGFYRLKYDVPSVADANGIPIVASKESHNVYYCSKVNMTIVVKTDITPATSDLFGAVRRGELTLQCAGFLAGIMLKRNSFYTGPEDREPTIILRIGAQLFGGNLHLDNSHRRNIPVPYYFLPIQSYTERNGKYFTDMLFGLLIVRTGLKQGEYRRLGMFELSRNYCSTEIKDDYFEDVLKDLDLGDGDTSPSWLFCSSNENVKFLTIV